MNKTNYEYDDPYKILAHAIVGSYRPADVLRIVTEDEFILNQIIKEVRSQDIGGQFVDCIIEDILGQRRRMEYMAELDKLAQYYHSMLDLPRLRKEIRATLDELGIELD